MPSLVRTNAIPRVTTRRFALTHDQVFEWSLFCLMAVITLTNLANLTPEKDSAGLDKFVLVKLILTGACGIAGLYGFFAVPRVQMLLFSLPGVWLTGLASAWFAAALFSPTLLISAASALSLWCILLFTVTVVVTIGPKSCLRAVLIGIALFVCASWVAWLALPSLGVFAEPLADGQFRLRMAGITHPNLLAQYAGLGAGLSVVTYQTGVVRSRMIWLLVPICLGAMLFSISRAATIALVVALAVTYRGRILQFTGLRALLLGGLVVTGGLLVLAAQENVGGLLSERQLSLLSKSGDTRELTSLTGRTEIWSYALRKVSERPLLGFGPATSKKILADYVGYTHNLWLNVLFCSGISGLIWMTGLTLGRVFDVFARPHRIADFIIVFIFVNGLAENVILSFIPGAPTVLLIVAVLWRANENIDAREGVVA